VWKPIPLDGTVAVMVPLGGCLFLLFSDSECPMVLYVAACNGPESVLTSLHNSSTHVVLPPLEALGPSPFLPICKSQPHIPAEGGLSQHPWKTVTSAFSSSPPPFFPLCLFTICLSSKRGAISSVLPLRKTLSVPFFLLLPPARQHWSAIPLTFSGPSLSPKNLVVPFP